MSETITFNDLLLYAFNETELSKTVAVTHSVESDTKVKKAYSDLIHTIRGIRSIGVQPSNEVSQRILKLAK